MEIRKLFAQATRVETGPTQFGDDWPGTFIRGDESAHYAACLEEVLTDKGNKIARNYVEKLVHLLSECNLTNR